MRIALYGYGYVGNAIAMFLRDHYKVVIVDPRLDAAPSDAEGCEFGIVSVPTLQALDGSCDISIVRNVIGLRLHRHYLVKSTVPPGTCDAIAAAFGVGVVFSPEYIGEGKYEVPWWDGVPHPTDMRKHPFHIFGGPREETRLWVEIWQRVAGWVASYSQTDARTAELVKYAENMFLATKKLFCSELFLTAQAFGVDYNELRELWLKDVRVGSSMTLVWPERLAFDGKCLPKDTSALVTAAAAAGHDPKLFRAVIERNRELADL